MSLTTEVSVSIDQQYAVTIGANIWKEVRNFCNSRYSGNKLVIIIDEYVSSLHGVTLRKECSAIFDELDIVEIPRGEQSKSITCWNKTLNAVLKGGVERNTPLLAVGGGVTGDLGGFVAATALGVSPLFICLPACLPW